MLFCDTKKSNSSFILPGQLIFVFVYPGCKGICSVYFSNFMKIFKFLRETCISIIFKIILK